MELSERNIDGSESRERETLMKKKNPRNSKTFLETLRAYPKHTGFIIGNEFCERFSYYGMKSVLLLYLRNYLAWSDDTSTSVYHAFTVAAYFFPLVGAVLADSYWGKYKTIVVLSVVYVLGHVLKTVGSIPYVPSHSAHVVLSMTGLFLIAAGTGGIKPCVSSFGGDQFSAEQSHLRKQFFSLFYFAINAGSLISTFITPIFRADVDCYPGEEGPEFQECFALAFGVPGALMLVALILFIAGSRWYTRRPPEGSVFVRMCKCLWSAVRNRAKTPPASRNKPHWIDYSDADEKMKRDTKYVMQILILFIPIPAFWALFDQQGSRWTLQAIQLDGNIGSMYLKPDQVEVLNPLLILILIPLFEFILYPLLERFKINFTALKRMTAGFAFTGLSFLLAAMLQIQIDKQLTALPSSSQFGVRFVNTFPCDTNVVVVGAKLLKIPSHQASEIMFFETGKMLNYSVENCETHDSTFHTIPPFEVASSQVQQVLLRQGLLNRMRTAKSETGGGRISFTNLAFDGKDLRFEVVGVDGEDYVVEAGKKSKAVDVPKGSVHFKVYDDSSSLLYEYDKLEVETGAVYSLFAGESQDTAFHTRDINGNSINVAWIFPQFIIITIGEVFLSITGLEFSYSQAPPSMKSVLASVWLLTVSLGNVIVLIVAEVKAIQKQSNEFFLFAGLVFLAGILFMFLASRYQLVDEEEFELEMNEHNKKEPLTENEDAEKQQELGETSKL